jgi:hypothetical protein
MSQDIEDTANLCRVRGVFLWLSAGWLADGLVGLAGVEDELAEEFAGRGVDDRMCRSWTRSRTRVPAWGRPVPMWWRRPLCRRVTSPVRSVRSVRTRSWVPAARSPGVAFGRAADAVAGVARPGGDLCGRRVLQMPAKVSGRDWSSARVAGWCGWARSQFFMVCWKRSALPWVWGWSGLPFFCLIPRRRSSCARLRGLLAVGYGEDADWQVEAERLRVRGPLRTEPRTGVSGALTRADHIS